VLAVSLIGSPGSGKTALLEQTVARLHPRLAIGVIEGDIATTRDAERLARLGVRAVQIETRLAGNACHLDANMVRTALARLPLEGLRLLFIENVGNLVCPVEYGLGEHVRVVVTSVPEGDDKPRKYPSTFSRVDAVVLNKTDLLPHTDFSTAAFDQAMREVSRGPVFPLSARTGQGLDGWIAWLDARRAARR
ncbi:MAG: hydrogenase nickel incorporation protein HypB, partial [Armatimonadota bacterium]|nr:hydrogenase nickel incorporation protein HypB [Armatimonadota bacterium]